MRVSVLLLMTILVPMSAAGQSRWEVEVHAGGVASAQPDSGHGGLPNAGSAFTTTTGLPSRREPSWYFGDGTTLINQVNAARGLSARVEPLDPVLTRGVAQPANGGVFGFRLVRRISARYEMEVTADYTRTPLMLSDTAVTAIEASRASFASAFNVPLPAGQQGAAPTVSATSTANVDRQRGSQLFTTGAISVNLITGHRVTPYVSFGAGVLTNSTDAPSVTLAGNYRITGPVGTPTAGVVVHDESDNVSLRFAVDRHAFVAVVGGGIKYAVASRWGVRLDVRAHLARNGVSNVIDATPSIRTLTPPAVLALPSNPSVQFSNNPSTGAQSSLNPSSAVADFQTFRGTGIRIRIGIVSGIYWRF